MKNNYKKYLKFVLIAISFLLIIIFIDTIQAKIFNNSPIISLKEELEDNDSYVDRGILIDTYYCTSENDIVTVISYFKGNKFTCPIDNEEDYSERAQNLINLLKDKMIEMKILDKDNLEAFDVLMIRESGYYEDSPEKKHITFRFKYSCKDDTDKCLPELFKKHGHKYDNNIAGITAYTDEIEIYELEHIAIHINDAYKQVSIEIK